MNSGLYRFQYLDGALQFISLNAILVIRAPLLEHASAAPTAGTTIYVNLQLIIGQKCFFDRPQHDRQVSGKNYRCEHKFEVVMEPRFNE